MILVVMNGNEYGYHEFWFEDSCEQDLYRELSKLNIDLDPNR